ncbi:MAG: hypothetical protein WCS69_05415 [Ignavibacteriaceae bacterium]|jgi:hypothetical protein
MTPHQENKLAMYGAVNKFGKRFAKQVSAIPALERAFSNLARAVSLIKFKSQNEEEAVAGTFELKQDTRFALIVVLVPATGALSSYARRNNLAEVKRLTFKITRGSLNKLNQTDLQQKTAILFKLLNENKANLRDYGIDASKIVNLKQKIDAFNTAINTHEESGSERSRTYIELNRAFSAADYVLRGDIDCLMEILREDNPEIYNEFLSARLIKDSVGGYKTDNEGIFSRINRRLRRGKKLWL